jgi:cbb3-type cytochrome oxidase maturation protein
MNILIILIPLALAMGALGLGAFLWAMKSRQFEDVEGAAWRIIYDEDHPPKDEPTPRA